MKNMTVAGKTRWAAGALYGILSIYQMFLTKVLLENASPSNVPYSFSYAVLLILAAAAMSVFMFYGKEALGQAVQRAIVCGTAFCVAFELMTYTSQTELINYLLSQYFTNLADNKTVLYVVMIVRLLLLILAAFFVTGGKEAAKKDTEDEDDSEEDTEDEQGGQEAEEDGESEEDTEILEIIEVKEEIDIIEVVKSKKTTEKTEKKD